LIRGVVYVAYGDPARREATASIQSLLKRNDLPVTVLSDAPLLNTTHVYAPDEDHGARWAKLNLNILSPYEHTLYLDADTRVYGDLSAGFDILADGWDLAITPSVNQIDTRDWLWHCDAGDRAETVQAWGFFPLTLQGGVFYVARNERTNALFAEWRAEWRRYRNQDQGALLRALQRVPVKIWLLGRPWNGKKGGIIEHLFGAARR
jgi:hypothetical protein